MIRFEESNKHIDYGGCVSALNPTDYHELYQYQPWMGIFGPEPPVGHTLYERQGIIGMRQAARYLRNQGMVNVSFNQDRNNEEKAYPDLTYYNPHTGRYEANEVKNLIETPRLEKGFTEEQVLGKTLIPNVPMSLILIHEKPIDPGAKAALTKTGIPVTNGLPVQGVFHSIVCNGRMEDVSRVNLTGDYGGRISNRGFVGPPAWMKRGGEEWKQYWKRHFMAEAARKKYPGTGVSASLLDLRNEPPIRDEGNYFW